MAKQRTIKSAVTLILLAIVNLSSAVSYEIVDLGTLGGARSRAHAINDSGAAGGYAEEPHGPFHRRLLYRPDNAHKDLVFHSPDQNQRSLGQRPDQLNGW